MPELPWKKFYPQDWKADPQLSRCCPATRGIWMDAIASMMLSNTDHISGTDAELARDCRCSEAEIQAANDELKRANVCKISMQNGCKTWTCRRLERELNVSKSRSNAASKRWSYDAKQMQKDNANTLQDVNANGHARSASASASVYASVSDCTTKEPHFPEAETPSWKEFFEYSKLRCGMPEWYAKDKFLKAQADHWKGNSNWRAYADRCRAWWENDGRPKLPPASRTSSPLSRPATGNL